MPHMKDFFFSKCVIYICEHNNNGAMGVIINKILENVPFTEKSNPLKQHLLTNDLYKNKNKIFFGGPIFIDNSLVLHKTIKKFTYSMPLSSNISISNNKNILKKIEKKEIPHKVLLGHSGWAPGQLENELKNGDWLMQTITEDFVFKVPADHMWEQAINSISNTLGRGGNS